MATPLRRRSTTKKGPQKSSSSIGKWIFFIILLLMIGAIAFALYLFRTGRLDGIIAETPELPMIEADDIIELEPKDEPLLVAEKTIEEKIDPPKEELPKQSLPSKKIAPPKPSRGYYVKLGDCLYESCVREWTRSLRQMKQPILRKKIYETTQYFEIVSASGYTKEQAMEQVRMLEKQRAIIGAPYRIKRQSQYWVTYGQYPDRKIAARTLSYLDQYRSNIEIEFHMLPQVQKYEMTRVYAGPYSKRRSAERIGRALQGNSIYQKPIITSKP